MTTRAVPAATAALRVLRLLSSHPTSVPASRISDQLGLARSTTYHLLAAMAAENFVIHYPEDRTWGIGVGAWEVGHSFAQREPLARLARVPMARLVDRVGQSAHLAMLHGSDVLYILEERAPGRPPLVTDVNVRMPAHLTASGRAIMASLTAAEVRALYPGRESFTSRTASGPRSSAELSRVLSQTRRRGYALEEGEVTRGFSSVALRIDVPSVRAAIAMTWASAEQVDLDAMVAAVGRTVAALGTRLGSR